MLDSPHPPNTDISPSADTHYPATLPVVPNLTQITPQKGVRIAYVLQFILTAAPLLIGDLLAVGVSFACADGAARLLVANVAAEIGTWPILVAIAVPSVFALFGLYPGAGLHPVAEFRKATVAAASLFTVLLAFAYVQGVSTAISLRLLATCVSVFVLVPTFRSAARTIVSRFRWWGHAVLIFGDDDTARRLDRYYRSRPRLGFRPVRILDDWLAGGERGDAREEAIRSERLRSLRNEHRGFWALLSAPFAESSTTLIADYLATFPRVLVVAGGIRLPRAEPTFDCAGLPNILVSNHLLLPSTRFVKLLMDYALVIVGGALCLPLIGLIALLVKATSRGPVFYAQKRIGRRGQPFWAWKFRTMHVDADQVLQRCFDADPQLRAEWERDHKLRNDPRVTLAGRWLRKTSLDELPQLWNVLRGEMSLVGPRPIVTEEIPKYGTAFDLYTRATPGITGLWQISGRNNTTYDERVEFDVDYVLNWSPWLDLYILARTIKVVIFREGAY